ncbi:MAG: B12-binding domain-containing radical SAM protein [Cyanobium sp. CZS 25K]|nr:B12-binding domain-containing radical SAM protein [Cyanobium sp. CZS25K]
MRVLLVYPEFPRTFWSWEKILELVGRKVVLPPLGLITVASLLPQEWEFRLVDCNIRPVAEEEWQWADLVILSAMIVQRSSLEQQIDLARSHGIPVAVGGPFASSTPGAPELDRVDYKILDEGEITLPLFVAALERGELGGCFRAGGEKPDITHTPIPRFDLLELHAYESLSVQFSRGCPFQCEFCDIIVLYGRKPRTKTPEQLLAELEAIHQLGWRRSVFIVDDNFIGNKRNVKLLLPQLFRWQKQRGFPFRFITEASVDLADDPELMAGMSRCRFESVFLGIETPDEASLATVRKLQNTRSPLIRAVDTISSYGIRVMAGFIIGFDGEQAGAGERITRFVSATGIPTAFLGMLQALPNTALWHRLEREGRLIADRHEVRGVNNTSLINFRPTRPIATIAEEFAAAFRALYEPTAYMERVTDYCSRKLGRPQWQRHVPNLLGIPLLPPKRSDLRALPRIVWRQGIRRSTRWLFWRSLLRVALQRPYLLEELLIELSHNEHFMEYRALVSAEITAQVKALGPLAHAELVPVVGTVAPTST